MTDVPSITTNATRAPQVTGPPADVTMNTYHHHLGRLAAHQTRRTQYAEEARRRATPEQLFSIDHLVAAAIRDAREEVQTFRDDFHAEPPAHLQYALDVETDAWERLEGGLILFAQAAPAPHEIPNYAGNVRAYLSVQLDLLGTAQELLYSCLTDQYVQRIDEISGRLAAVNL